MYRLINPVKAYAWGDSRFIQDLLGLEQKTLAELWMGAHPADPSRILIGNEEQTLDQYLPQNQQPDLPFLFKVLAAGSPLSIQVHPSQAKARAGFARENKLGLALDDPLRNYKDANHKPEMLLALTEFEALCGFREYSEIVTFLELFGLDAQLPAAVSFILKPSVDGLSGLIRQLLELDSEAKAGLVRGVLEIELTKQQADQQAVELQSVCRSLNSSFPSDIGCLFPLFLRYLKLKPYEAIFISHSTPHAYLKGAGLELMASSDNVLRGALTPKHIDIDELIKICSFEPQAILKVIPSCASQVYQIYSPPVNEFELMLFAKTDLALPPSPYARIALCVSGTYRLKTALEELALSKGEAVFITAGEEVCIRGDGSLAIAGTPETIKN